MEDTAQEELVSRLNYFTDWKDKYKYIIELGKQMPKFAAEDKTEANLIHGCQSQVWIKISQDPTGKVQLSAVSDAAIVSGLIALLLKVYNNKTPQEILDTQLDFLAKTGLLQHLTPNRSTGLYHMIKKIQDTAKELLTT